MQEIKYLRNESQTHTLELLDLFITCTSVFRNVQIHEG